MMRHWAVIGFAALIGGMIVVRPAGAAPNDPARPESAVERGGNPLWGIPLSMLSATRDRPVFVPSRRPPAPPAVPVAAAPAAAPPPPTAEPEQLPLKLLGTIASRDQRIAICLNQINNDVVRVRVGESFNGWVLRSVDQREASFEKATRTARLALPTPDETQAAPPTFAMPNAPALPLPVAAGAPPPPATQARAPAASGTWRDGDGNLIAAPKSR